MANEVMCRVCRRRFDRDKLEENVDWVQPSPRYYYHLNCWRNWKQNRNNIGYKGRNEHFWHEAMVDFLYKTKKMDIDFARLNKMWKSYLKPPNKYTAKGIYFALKYFYDVQKNDIEKANGSIGIVPHIYNESAEYWANLEFKRRGTIEEIERQIDQRSNRPVRVRQEVEAEEKKPKWFLDDI